MRLKCESDEVYVHEHIVYVHMNFPGYVPITAVKTVVKLSNKEKYLIV